MNLGFHSFGGRRARRPTRLSRCSLVFVLLLALGSSGVAAQAAEQGSAAELQYRSLVQQAVEGYERGDYEEATALFREAHRVLPSARTLRGMGLVAFAKHDYVRAISELQRALDDRRKALTVEQSKEVRLLIGRARSYIGSIRAQLPSDAKLQVNGWDVAREPDGRWLLNPGQHEVRAVAPGYRSQTRIVRIEPGATLELDFALEPASAGELASTPAAGEAARDLTTHAAHSSERDGPAIAPLVLIAVSGAVAIGGGVLLGLGLHDVATVENAGPQTSWSEIETPAERSTVFTAAGGIMIGAGVLGAAAGLTWYLLDGAESEQPTLSLGPRGAQLRVAF